MGYLKSLFDHNFLEYASYVIKDRAIPDIDDGLKPVQRRILHTLHENDDGKYHKVANIVGSTMKYHPHGDQSISSALIVLANKELFIDRQGNFGNLYTGDSASAPRYIECRLSGLAREVLFFPDITEYVPSYDSRNREPVRLPAKLPVLLAMGTEGIAVGMATKILPHNLIELLNAEISVLQGEEFEIYPDFLTAGDMDISEYAKGNGKVLVRAKIDISDPKRIIIKEIPYGQTTESLISSIEQAARKNKFKISGINDYTTENVEIEITLPRGVQSKDVIEPLYAFTDCEISIATNLLCIKNNHPTVMDVNSVIEYNAQKLLDILKLELQFEKDKLKHKLHIKTLEQLFIEKRIYKNIEKQTTSNAVYDAVMEGFIPYLNLLKKEIEKDDIDHLLKIPIRRISLYDINKAKREMKEIKDRLKEINAFLADMVTYTIDYIKALIAKYKDQYPRHTRITSFSQVDAREAAIRDKKLRYDPATGFLGIDVSSGNHLFNVSTYDRILVIRKDGIYSVIDVPEKQFIGKGMVFCGFIDKDRVYNIIYKQKRSGYPFIKRCRIEKFILNKEYRLIPEGDILLKHTNSNDKNIVVNYKPKPRLRVLEETFYLDDYNIRGNQAGGIRLSKKELRSVKFSNSTESKNDSETDIRE